MRYLITGHTGFKGAWLTVMLRHLGHQVSGIALDPLPGSLFEQAALQRELDNDVRLDIREYSALQSAIHDIAPDVVVHLAAQPLVRESYRDPRTTIETNVNGTLNVLQATSTVPSVQAQLIVTTDKVYKNTNKHTGYVETDPLGGHDPYSASKAAADLLTQSWTASFPGPPTAIARAGNVIGGGDVSPERLLPDLLNAYAAGKPATLRYPDAVRPWQHVLDCLNGYLTIINALLNGHPHAATPWNIGPTDTHTATVGDIATRVAQLWGNGASWTTTPQPQPPETGYLTLDATRARTNLNWTDKLSLDEALTWTINWHKALRQGGEAQHTMLEQVSIHRTMTANRAGFGSASADA